MINYCSCGFADNASVSPHPAPFSPPGATLLSRLARAYVRPRAHAVCIAMGRRAASRCSLGPRCNKGPASGGVCPRAALASATRRGCAPARCDHLVVSDSRCCPSPPRHTPAETTQSDLTDALEQTWNFIDTALSSHPRWVVLVHCASGISRSVALVCHYLMRKQYLSFQDSIQFIRSRHPAAEPNSSFVEQLKLVDVQLRKQRALQQAECGAEETLPASPSIRAPCDLRPLSTPAAVGGAVGGTRFRV